MHVVTPSLHLVPICHHLHKYALCLLAVCRVVESSVVCSGAGCVAHVDVHGERVMLWVAAMYNVVVILSMAGVVCLACMQKLCSA